MAIEVPATPKVYTTTYDNFKGVDFTNDSTNVWRRRSPTGTNMLPDASGRPMKRNGWNILLSNADLCDVFGLFSYEVSSVTEEEFNENKTLYFTESGGDYTRCTSEDVWDENETYYVRAYDDLEVLKCAYFELAGRDHIAIFTDRGVIFYNGEDTAVGMEVEGVTAINTDADCYMSFDRCFFFEGNGTSAFYIYGNFRVWKYGYDGVFSLTEMTNNLTIPTLTILTSADGVGEFYQGYNLLGSMISVKYNDTDLFTFWGSDELDFTVDKTTFTSVHTTKNYSQKYTYDGSNWKDESATTVSLATNGISLYSTPKDGDEIYVIYANGVVLPNTFNVAGQSNLCEVRYTKSGEFDAKLNLETASAPATDEFRPHADPVNRTNKRAWIEFNPSQNFGNPDPTQDYIKVTAPATEVASQQYTETLSFPATFNGEEV